MANTYGKIYRGVWSDEDFLDLSIDAQWLFMALVSNPQISHAGVLPFAPGRYVGLARNMSARKFTAALNELRNSRHILAEKHTGEILIRSYLRHDAPLRNQNLSTAAVKAIQAVYSPSIRDCIVDELARLCQDEPNMPGWEIIHRDDPALMDAVSEKLLAVKTAEDERRLTAVPDHPDHELPRAVGDAPY